MSLRFFFGFLISLLIISSSKAQVSTGAERFLPYITTTTGTIPCKLNDGTPITHQVYDEFVSPSIPAVMGPTAAVKGSTIEVKAKLWIQGPFIGTVELTDVKFHGTNLPAVMPFAFIATLSSTSYEFDITVGPLPDFVDLGDLVVNLKTTESDGDFEYIGHAGTYFKLYIVTKTPVDPQAQPWIGVLEDSCTWAKSKTTMIDVLQSLTQGLYSSGKIIYGPTGFSNGLGNNPRNNFSLAFFLSESLEGSVIGDCYDTSNFLSICFASQGHISEVVFQWRIGGFTTNSLSLIGYQSSYIQAVWGNHQMVLHHNSDGTVSNAIADACAGLEGNNGAPIHNQNLPAYWYQTGGLGTSSPWLVHDYSDNNQANYKSYLPVVIINP